jgi:glycosyltransferase involved in cell wall biosynthesis
LNQTVDIIIPTINRENQVEECLGSIRTQTIQPESIIIVDASDHQKLKQILTEKYADLPICYVHCDKGLPYQRNTGLNYIKSEWILFLDDDIVLQPDYIEEALSALKKNPEFDVLTGKIINHNRKIRVNPLLVLFQRVLYLSESTIAGFKSSGDYNVNHPNLEGPVEVGVAIGCSSMFNRRIFKEYTYDVAYQYLEGYASLEDEDFSLQVRHKYRILYCTKTQAYHNRESAGGTRLSIYKSGRIRTFNHRYLYRKHKQYHEFRPLPHFLSCLGFILEALINGRSLTRARGLISGLILFRKKKFEIEKQL